MTEKPGADLLPPEDKGRFAVTRSATDAYVFRSPSLRNIAITPPYFHTGKVWRLKQAVAIMGSSPLGTTLTEQETEMIVAFLNTLTGKQSKVQYPILPAFYSGYTVTDHRPARCHKVITLSSVLRKFKQVYP